MKSLPASFDPQCPAEKVRELLAKAERILHPSNVYVCRLRTALFHLTGSLDTNIGMLHKQIYENYKFYKSSQAEINCFRCFPEADRHVGYQLLHIVKGLIENGKRNEVYRLQIYH
ncbi:unnamed protein product [Strongylus vulgaris]|uniref:Uncharacterized protein n=1 Tax=Strongylus vulgaris TaxID=40348 RepID=A0A3P7JGW8_STRVU|nr:unnamed protein product [Strongylus vulgaris]